MFRLLVVIIMACAISCSSAPEVDVPGEIALLEKRFVGNKD